MNFFTPNAPAPPVASSYRIDQDRNTRIEEYHGKVRLEEMRSMATAMVSDPGWSPDQHGLTDLTHAELEMSSNDVLRMALTLRQETHRTRGWMVFAVTDPVAFGVVRMLGYWSRATDRIRILPSRARAEAWLARHRHVSPFIPRDHPTSRVMPDALGEAS